MLMSALQGKFTMDQLVNQRFGEMAQAEYQKGLLDYYQRQTDLTASGQVLEAHKNRIAAANTYLDYLQEANEDTRTIFQQDYEYAKKLGFEGSPADWKTLSADPTSWREYKKAVDKSGYTGTYPDFLLKYKGSDTTINLPLPEQLDIRSTFQGPEYFSGEQWQDDLESYLGSDEFMMESLQYSEDTAEYEKFKRTKAEDWIYSRLKGTGASVKVREGSGGGIVFVATWTLKDGTTITRNVSYGSK